MTVIKKIILVSAVLFLLLSPVVSLAQCEPPDAAAAAATAVATAQAREIKEMTKNLKESFSSDMEIMRASLSPLRKIDWLWERWHETLLGMTKQFSAATVLQTQEMSHLNDANNAIDAAFEMQKAEVESKQTHQPTEATCRFDTVANPFRRSREISSALTSGYSDDFTKLGDNNKQSIAATGPSAMQAVRWGDYESIFCDKNAHGGHAGCKKNYPTKNMNVLPSRTIFGRDTIDLSDEETRKAVNELLFNITAFTPPEPIAANAIKSASGRLMRQMNREYLAQTDAVGALAYSVVAERAPGMEAPAIRAAREKLGIVNPSATPSEREIRESVVEQLWTPEYYKDLYDNPATVAQKELYLKAYNLVMLYDMIARQEKISNVYAIETANIIGRAANVRGTEVGDVPTK